MAVFVVRLGAVIGRIAPRLHGHFLEHVGSAVYGGVWDEERHALHEGVVAAVQALAPPVIRWPGGCFAERYHWRDGIGPRAARPRRVNTSWGDAPETNAFGTEEFLGFSARVGAEPFLTGNISSGTPDELAGWIAYCNHRVALWGMGNEPWGCGGGMTAAEYARAYARFAERLGREPHAPAALVASGPDGADTAWTEGFFDALRATGGSPPLHAFAIHYYVGAAGTATDYTDDDFVTLLARAHATETVIASHLETMRRLGFDAVPLTLEEWGTWHPISEPAAPALWQPTTIRDGLVAAMTLDALNRRANAVSMANLAQLVNVLMTPIHRERERVLTTAVFDVLRLYAPHRGATSLAVDVDAPRLGPTGALPQVVGSASLAGHTLSVTMVNASPRAAIEVELRIEGDGATTVHAEATILEAASPRARAFERARTREVPASGATSHVELPAHAVARVALQLA